MLIFNRFYDIIALGVIEMLPLYDNIRRRRIELNLSQQELADKLGYTSRTTIAKIEAGKIDLPNSKITALAKVLDIHPGILMGWTEPQNIKTWRYKTIENGKLVTKIPGLVDGENINYQFEQENNSPVTFDISPNTFILSEPEKKLITAYRNKPEMQPAINKILGIEAETEECKHKSTTEKTHIIKIAARNGSYKELALNDEELEELQRKIDSLPEATDL